MIRLMSMAMLLIALPLQADDPPAPKLTPAERMELETKLAKLSEAGVKSFQAGKIPDAIQNLEGAIKAARLLYPKAEYPDGHVNIALNLSNLAFMYKSQGNLAQAERLLREAIDMRKRLHKGDHQSIAVLQFTLAGLFRDQDKHADAEPLYKDAVAMFKRLAKGDNPYTAVGLHNLGYTYQSLGKLAEAELAFKEATEMHRRLYKGDHKDITIDLTNLGSLYREQGKPAAAASVLKEALEMQRRLFRGDHPDVATSLNMLGVVHSELGKLAEAESFSRDSLAMRQRLFMGDHPSVATSMNNLASLYEAQGKLAEAEPLYKNALGMYRRLYKGDNRDVAMTLNNLAELYRNQERWAEAEPLFKESLAIFKKLYKGDHPFVVSVTNNVAALYVAQGKLAEAEPLLKDSLLMRKRLHKDDHPHVIGSLNNLGYVYRDQGKFAESEPLFKESLAMSKRLFKNDHPLIPTGLSNLAFHYQAQGKLADAAPLFAEALAMQQRLMTSYAVQKSEGAALTLVGAQTPIRDAYLSVTQLREASLASIYSTVWAGKGSVARVFEQRHLRARAATDPALAAIFARLVEARQRRAQLLLAPATKDPDMLDARRRELKRLTDAVDELEQDLSSKLPVVARTQKLDTATLADLQKSLPADAAVVDFNRYISFVWDGTAVAGKKQTQTPRYLAFVTTRDMVARVELDTATNVEEAVAAWRAAITSGKDIPPEVPNKVRELVWEKVRKQLPTGIKTVYICPDADLCRVPFAAIPGDMPGTILLEDFALATIPHAPFLLDKLWPQDPIKNPPTAALVVGGVKYDAEVAAPSPNPNTVASRGDPLLKPGAKLGWSFLPGTTAEATGVSQAATTKKLTLNRLTGENATSEAVLAALPKAKVAHLATHGFFADPSFRSAFQLNPKDYEQSLRGERIGGAARSPLVMTGLVSAGANNPKTPGRGIVTGEALVDLDLSGLELVVLSACETGVGDVAGGEGTFGLQRAFHYAGTTNVIASLWKVPDQSTAALMALFYRNLWNENLSPMESLRQAQLEIYRNPGKIPELAKGFRGKFEEVAGAGEPVAQPSKEGKTHPLLWAAFSLSGSGR